MNSIREKGEILLDAFEDFRKEVMNTDKNLYHRWRAGGFQVSSEFVCMYGNVEELIEKLSNDEDDYDDDDSLCADDGD